MGYLDKTTITVDAILTKKGRELLAKGSEFFEITQFALADDEIDYNLWDVNHSLGSNYYGQAIEALPLVEAVPDETQVCKYKLVTLPKNIARMPTVTAVPTAITLTSAGQSALISPTTTNFANGNATYGYTAILSDTDVCYLNVAPGGGIDSRYNPTVADFSGDTTKSISVAGKRFQVVAKPQPIESKTATITIIGNETGGVVTITVSVNKENLSSNVLEQAMY
tara:strand:- start:484 stop:1155 length:672 start_codon:yes stop_codon:yes gene_type:complete